MIINEGTKCTPILLVITNPCNNFNYKKTGTNKGFICVNIKVHCVDPFIFSILIIM